MMKIISVVTSIAAWIIKNTNMMVGVIGAIGKVIAGLINVFQPSKDALVDLIESYTEKIQAGLFKLSEILKKFTGSTG